MKNYVLAGVLFAATIAAAQGYVGTNSPETPIGCSMYNLYWDGSYDCVADSRTTVNCTGAFNMNSDGSVTCFYTPEPLSNVLPVDNSPVDVPEFGLAGAVFSVASCLAGVLYMSGRREL